ncbi:Frizzled/Smoothened transmembrane domain [Trinorchestia longiramus]|nr:Frizzled/Smoothened transmembrane domain [Trinorchestia longiramus]
MKSNTWMSSSFASVLHQPLPCTNLCPAPTSALHQPPSFTNLRSTSPLVCENTSTVQLCEAAAHRPSCVRTPPPCSCVRQQHIAPSTCYAGHGSSIVMVRWVLLPLLLPLLLGAAMLMLVFARLWRVQLAINKRRPQYFPNASAAGYIGSTPCCNIGTDRGRINGNTSGPGLSNTSGPGLSNTSGPGHRCVTTPKHCSSIGAIHSSTIGSSDTFSKSKLEAASSSCCSQRDANVGHCTSKCIFRCADCEVSLCHQTQALRNLHPKNDLKCNSNYQNEQHTTKTYNQRKEWKSCNDRIGRGGTNSATENASSKTYPILTSSQGIDISSENRSVLVSEVPMDSSNQFSNISLEEQRRRERLSGSYPEVHPKSNKTATKCQHEDRQIEDPGGPSLTFQSKVSKKSNKYSEVDQRKPMVLLPPDISRRPAQKAVRIGVVAMLYMLPTACLVGAVFQESAQRDQWQQDPSKPPSIEVFMLKIFTSLAPGIALSLFLGNNRVMLSWRQLGEQLYAIHSRAQDSLQLPDDEKSYCWAYGPDTNFSGHQCIHKLQSQVHGVDEASRRRSCRCHNCYSGHVPSDEAQKPPQCREKLRGGETAKPILKRSKLPKAGPSVRCKNAAFPLTTEDGSVVSDSELHASTNATVSDPFSQRQEYIVLDSTPLHGQHENQALATISGVMHENTTDGAVAEPSKIISNNLHPGLSVDDARIFPRNSAKNHLKVRNADFVEEEVISVKFSSDRISRGNLELRQNSVILGEVLTYQNERPSHALSPTNRRKEQCSLRPERETLPFVDPDRRALSSPNSKGKKQDESLSKKTLKNKRPKDRETSL